MSSPFEIYQRLGIQALEALLRTNAQPQRLFYFFPPSGEPEEKSISKDTKWQLKLLGNLVSRAIVKEAQGHFAIKNRYYVENLLKEARLRGAGDRKFMQMVCEAANIAMPSLPDSDPAPAPPPAPPKAPEPVRPKEFTTNTQEFTIDDSVIKPHKVPRSEVEPKPKVPVVTAEEAPRAPKPAPKHDEPDEIAGSRVAGDLATVILLLRNLTENFEQHDLVQTKLIENIVYVRDRGEKLHERFKALGERIANLEQLLNVPRTVEQAGTGDVAVHDVAADVAFDNLTSSVNSMSEIVGSVKDEVRQVMQSTLQSAEATKLSEVRAVLAKISSEFAALQQLTLESLSETAS